jgi:hypothetical protein
VLRKKFTDALSMKIAYTAGLADAEKRCYDWESAARQVLGETEVEKILQEHGIDEGDTVKGQYMTAVGRIKMRDFCMSRNPRVARLTSNSVK